MVKLGIDKLEGVKLQGFKLGNDNRADSSGSS
jgi:hypothetical protein